MWKVTGNPHDKERRNEIHPESQRQGKVKGQIGSEFRWGRKSTELEKLWALDEKRSNGLENWEVLGHRQWLQLRKDQIQVFVIGRR